MTEYVTITHEELLKALKNVMDNRERARIFGANYDFTNVIDHKRVLVPDHIARKIRLMCSPHWRALTTAKRVRKHK